MNTYRSRAPRGARGLKSLGVDHVRENPRRAPRGARGLKSLYVIRTTARTARRAPRGARGLKSELMRERGTGTVIVALLAERVD